MLDVAESHPQRLNVLVSFSLLVGFTGLWIYARARPPWGDEWHFLETVRLFGQGASLDLLRTYPEMSAPLTYLTYSAWGHVVGFSTPALRLLSPLIAWGAATVWWFAIRRHVRSAPMALLALGVMVFNPYFVGLSVFVFTDMLSLLGMALVVLGVDSRRPWLSAVGLIVATTARQYLVFLVPALLIADFLVRPRSVRPWRFTASALVGTLPLIALIVLWEGHVAPASIVRDTYLTEGLRFDLHALALYLAMPGAYLILLALPIAIRVNASIWGAAALAGLFVLVFPVQASIAQTREGAMTVGFLHRALSSALPAWGTTVFFAVMATLGTAGLLYCGQRTLSNWRTGARPMTTVFLWAGVGSFLVVMPFSYMPWEKYALPLLMLSSLIFARNAGAAEDSMA